MARYGLPAEAEGQHQLTLLLRRAAQATRCALLIEFSRDPHGEIASHWIVQIDTLVNPLGDALAKDSAPTLALAIERALAQAEGSRI